MDTEYLLEKAKELLVRDKGLIPVLFIETEKNMNIVGITGDFNNANKRKMMIDAGIQFRKDYPDSNIISLCMISEGNISKIHIDTENVEISEVIVIARLNVADNKKEILTQDFERKDGIITFHDHYKTDDPAIFILDAFMTGFLNKTKSKTDYNRHMQFRANR